ncbi:hypothetical protein ACVWZD_000338 [Streptomyces sp. TE3672]
MGPDAHQTAEALQFAHATAHLPREEKHAVMSALTARFLGRLSS